MTLEQKEFLFLKVRNILDIGILIGRVDKEIDNVKSFPKIVAELTRCRKKLYDEATEILSKINSIPEPTKEENSCDHEKMAIRDARLEYCKDCYKIIQEL